MSKENTSTLNGLRNVVDDFAKKRDWEKFHTPRNLAASISIEAAELLEIFQWSNNDEISQAMLDRASSEMADIFIYLLRMSSVLDIDLLNAANEKVKLNASKYPVEKVKGKSKKYNEY